MRVKPKLCLTPQVQDYRAIPTLQFSITDQERCCCLCVPCLKAKRTRQTFPSGMEGSRGLDPQLMVEHWQWSWRRRPGGPDTVHCTLLCPWVFSCFYDCLSCVLSPLGSIMQTSLLHLLGIITMTSRVFVGPHCGSLFGSHVPLIEKKKIVPTILY